MEALYRYFSGCAAALVALFSPAMPIVWCVVGFILFDFVTGVAASLAEARRSGERWYFESREAWRTVEKLGFTVVTLCMTYVIDVVVLDFTPEMAQMTARDFMCRVLSERLGVEALVIGYDHRFGRNRSEGFEDYVRYGRELGMEVVRGEVCLVGDEPVSSTRVRGALAVGDVAEAARLLGYAYRLCGKVVGGYRVGRKIGFPTANLCLDGCDKLLPADGVYAVRVNVDVDDNDNVDGVPSLITPSSPRIGMLNIGHRPTVNNGAERSFEVHIIGFEGDLYGRPLCIELVERLREERSFASLEELTAQLANDRETVMAIFNYNT